MDNVRWKGKYSQSIGLARLCETYFGQTLPKGRVQRSNWEAVLSPLQQDCELLDHLLWLFKVANQPSSPDAANDCHSGWALLTHLYSMMPEMRPLPLPSFYSFDMVNGMALQPTSLLLPTAQRVLWNPYNPFYDPGPPPERPPKSSQASSQKSGSSSRSDTGPTSGDNTAQSSSQSGDRRPRHRWQRGGFPRSEGPRGNRHWQNTSSRGGQASASDSQGRPN